MAQALQFPKGKQTPPSQAQSFEARLEEKRRLRKHTEARSGLPTGETAHVAAASTGEMVELDPVRKLSAFEIYSKIKKHFEMKSAQQMSDALGVTVTEDTPVGDSELDEVMRNLAEDIYDALQRAHQSIEIIKPESIGSKTIARLDEKGDANFLVAAGEGERLYESLQDQEADFRTVRKNSYGFVLKNEATDFRVVFIYQERLTGDGRPADQETPEEDENSDAAAGAKGQQAANQANLGQGGSLAA